MTTNEQAIKTLREVYTICRFPITKNKKMLRQLKITAEAIPLVIKSLEDNNEHK